MFVSVCRTAAAIIIGSMTLTACGGGGGSQPTVLPQTSSFQSAFRTQAAATQVTTPPHFLYAAALSVANIYMLPMTSKSVPAHSISGFGAASDVSVSGADIDITDNENGALDVYVATSASTFVKRCSLSVPAPEAVTQHIGDLYLTSAVQGLFHFANGALGPCSSQKPTNTHSGLSGPTGVAADNQFIYVADAAKSTLVAYKQPLTSGEAPSMTVALDAPPQSLAVSNTDLYVTFNNGVPPGEIDDFKLPLSNTSKPTKVRSAVIGTGYGSALFPVPNPCTNPTELFVSDGAAIYTFKLPLTTASTPSVTTPFTNAFGLAVQ